MVRKAAQTKKKHSFFFIPGSPMKGFGKIQNIRLLMTLGCCQPEQFLQIVRDSSHIHDDLKNGNHQIKHKYANNLHKISRYVQHTLLKNYDRPGECTNVCISLISKLIINLLHLNLRYF